MTPRKAVHLFRFTALAEAVSYLVLLGIAMPMKYIWDIPLAVKIVGSIHGALFILFGITLLLAMRLAHWSLSRAVMLFIASLIPLVPFWLDSRIRTWVNETTPAL